MASTALFCCLILLNGREAFSAETLTIGDGETADNQTISSSDTYNILEVNSNGTATETTVNSGGYANINSGGTASNTTVNSDGTLTVNAGGTASNTTVGSNGTIKTVGAATVDGLTLDANSKFSFTTEATVTNIQGSSGSIQNNTASDLNITKGSVLEVVNNGTSDGTAENIKVNGGTLVFDKGLAKDIEVNSGIIEALTDRAVLSGVIIEAQGAFRFSTNATIDAIYDSNYQAQELVIKDHRIQDLILGSNGILSVDAVGVAENLTVGGGVLIVNTDGTASDTTVTSGTMTVSGGTASNTTVQGGVLDVTSGTVKDLTISDIGTVTASGGTITDTTVTGGSFTLNSGAEASSITLNGGTMTVNSDGTATNTIVNSGGTLFSESGGILNGLIAANGSVINLAVGTILKDSINIYAGADLSLSSSVFSNLFDGSQADLTTLTITNGVNTVFNNRLVNETSEDKNLIFSLGTYTLSDLTISGWDTLTLASGTTARLTSSLAMSGTNKNFIINNGATLDVSGTLENVVSATIDGNLINNGAIDFTLSGANSSDVLTVTGDFEGKDGSMIIMDINPVDGTSDKLSIGGDVKGTSSVYLKFTETGNPTDSILFAEAPSNVTGNSSSFNIWRVDGSPFEWDVLFDNNQWYSYALDKNRPTITPETAAYYGLIDTTFMQTASLGASLRKNIAESEPRQIPCPRTAYSRYTNRICHSSRPTLTGWAAPVYTTARIQDPYNYTANIGGLDGGLDLIGNTQTKFGLMASYRKGSYSFDSDGKNYKLKSSADISLNSYLGGLYLRHDSRLLSVVAAAYAGKIDGDVSTADGVEGDVNGTTYGITLDVSMIYENINGIRLEPGVRVSYASVDLDEIKDNAGKTTEFDNSTRTEIEAGLKIAKRWRFPEGKAEIYAKPSFVHILNNTSDFVLLENLSLEAASNRTLARLEAGMSFDLTNNWSAALSGSYSFGSDYQDATANLSLIYNF